MVIYKHIDVFGMKMEREIDDETASLWIDDLMNRDGWAIEIHDVDGGHAISMYYFMYVKEFCGPSQSKVSFMGDFGPKMEEKVQKYGSRMFQAYQEWRIQRWKDLWTDCKHCNDCNLTKSNIGKPPDNNLFHHL